MGRVYQALVRAGHWEAEQDTDVAETAASSNRPEDHAEPSSEVPEPAVKPFAARPRKTEIAGSESPRPVLLHVAEPSQSPSFNEPVLKVDAASLPIKLHMSALTGSDLLAKERYHTLAVRMLNAVAKRKLKTILVTSAVEGEGKSTVATNLAWMLARAPERRVLLIEADLRQSALGTLLGIRAHRGWGDFVTGNGTLVDSGMRIDPNGLYLLPAGGSNERTRASASEALTTNRLEDLLAELEEQFDLVIVDGPAINVLADSQRFAAIVDGVLLVVRAGRTRHGEVASALKLIPKERRLAVVLNQTRVERAYKFRNKRAV